MNSLWGVLVSVTSPTTSNGLVPYIRARQRPSSPLDDDGEQSPYEQLRRLVHPSIASSFYPPLPVSPQQQGPGPSSFAEKNEQGEGEGDDEGCLRGVTVLVPLAGEYVHIGRLHRNEVELPTNLCISGVHCTLTATAASAGAGADVEDGGEEKEREEEEEGRRSGERAGTDIDTLLGLPRVGAGDARDGQGPRRKSAEEAEAVTAAAAAASCETALRVALSDTSTNGCYVNGHKVGKGRTYSPLKSGDVVELVNAGRRHTDEYNLKFLFFFLPAFQTWLRQRMEALLAPADGRVIGGDGASPPPALAPPPSPGPSSPAPTAEKESAAAKRKAEERRARRKALLLRAQWNVAAQVERMYAHDVEEFYRFCPGPNALLGEGAFGKVYRAALKRPHAGEEAAAAAVDDDNEDDEPAVFPSAAEVASWSAEEEVARRRHYVRAKAREAPASAVLVQQQQQRQQRRSAMAASRDSGEAVDVRAYPFAVKVIHKKRLLLEVLDGMEDATATAGTGTAPAWRKVGDGVRVRLGGAHEVTVSAEEKDLLEDLIHLETQPEEKARRRERDWASLEVRNALHSMSAPTPSQSLQPSLGGGGGGGGHGGASLSGDSPQRQLPEQEDRQPVSCSAPETTSDKEVLRQQLLARLNPDLRKQYNRELQQLRRQQCEVSVLLTVQHNHVTRLYEVFDGPDRLSLVMEQALGGEAWDLLQPIKPPPPSTSSSLSPSGVMEGGTGDDGDDDEGMYTGGPLPEFLVKILILQVLEAVHYLHTMGIAHRDLKLENLLLQRPCRVPAMCALQLEMLSKKIQQYMLVSAPGEPRGSHAVSSSSSSSSPSSRLVLNPISPLYTVHIPRSLWPVVKVTDFGLSWMVERGGRPRGGDGHGHGHAKSTAEPRPLTATAADNAEGNAKTNRPPLYSRNDMMTSCGTPIYAAPEVTHPALRPDRTGYSAAVDLFSVGVIAYALLTGRIPFPKREIAGRSPVIDYNAPLQFERCRKGRPPPPPPPPPLLEEILPPIALADTFRIPTEGHSGSTEGVDNGAGVVGGGGGGAPADRRGHSPIGQKRAREAHKLLSHADSVALPSWEVDMDAVAARVAYVERKKKGCPGTAAAATDDRTGGVADGFHSTLFPSTLRETLRAIRHYTERREREGKELDLERFFQASVGALHDGSARALAGDPSSVLSLPPVSPLGQNFLRGLLRLHPAQRMTAWDALHHPWLRDCQEEA